MAGRPPTSSSHQDDKGIQMTSMRFHRATVATGDGAARRRRSRRRSVIVAMSAVLVGGLSYTGSAFAHAVTTPLASAPSYSIETLQEIAGAGAPATAGSPEPGKAAQIGLGSAYTARHSCTRGGHIVLPKGPARQGVSFYRDVRSVRISPRAPSSHSLLLVHRLAAGRCAS